MPDPIPDLSRRKLLRVASYSTLAALAACVRSQAETEMTEKLSAQAGVECDREKDCSFKIPDQGGEERDVAASKLFMVADVLWTKFKGGVNYDAANDVVLAPGVFQKAFEMSGPFVLCHLADYPDDPNEIDPMNCTAICGRKATDKARQKKKDDGGEGPPTIDATIFDEAWCETQSETREKFARVQAMGGGPTGGLAGEPGGELPELTGGLGCN